MGYITVGWFTDEAGENYTSRSIGQEEGLKPPCCSITIWCSVRKI